MQIQQNTAESRHLKLKTEVSEVEKNSRTLSAVQELLKDTKLLGQKNSKILLHLCKKVQCSEISDWTLDTFPNS